MFVLIKLYDSIICVVDNSKKKMLALKFKIQNNTLFAFNYYNAMENRKLIEVTKINGIPVSSFINEVTELDLYNVEIMHKYNINIENSLVLELSVDDRIIEYDVYNLNSKDEVFEKPFDINKNVDVDMSINITSNQASDNVMLDHASTNVKSLLSMLQSLSASSEDKKVANGISETINEFNSSFTNINDNLDMLFLSTQLLMIDEEIHRIPENIERLMAKCLRFDFGSKDYADTNNAILTDGNVDYRKVIVMMRNGICHSNYHVLENGIVEFYNEGKDKMNFTIHKDDLKLLFHNLYQFYHLEGTFPIIYSNSLINNPNPFSENELTEYLKEIELIELTNPRLKTVDDLEKQRDLDDDLLYDLANFKKSLSLPMSNIINSYNIHLNKHLVDSCKLVSSKLSVEDLKYVLSGISHLGNDYFYHLGKTAQIEVINTLIRRKHNKKYELLRCASEIIDNGYDNNDSLTQKSSDYIKMQTKIELVITAIFNNLFSYCFNNNKFARPSRLALNATNIRFPNELYEACFTSIKNDYYKSLESFIDYEHMYDALLQASETHMVDKATLSSVERRVAFNENSALDADKQHIEYLNHIIDGNATNEEYNAINLVILKRFRDCLAHGRMIVECNNINDIGSSHIIIQDIFEGETKFHVETSFKDIINAINEPVFLESMLNNNQNFLTHKR